MCKAPSTPQQPTFSDDSQVTIQLDITLKTEFPLVPFLTCPPPNIIQDFEQRFDQYPFMYYSIPNFRSENGICTHQRCVGGLEINEWSVNEFKPERIEKVFCFENGNKKSKSWIIVGTLRGVNSMDGLYFHFKAYCDKNGFESGGAIKLHYSTSFEKLKPILPYRLRKAMNRL